MVPRNNRELEHVGWCYCCRCCFCSVVVGVCCCFVVVVAVGVVVAVAVVVVDVVLVLSDTPPQSATTFSSHCPTVLSLFNEAPCLPSAVQCMCPTRYVLNISSSSCMHCVLRDTNSQYFPRTMLNCVRVSSG